MSSIGLLFNGRWGVFVVALVASLPMSTTVEAQRTLSASDVGEGDRFGWSVALSQDTILVGAPFHAGEEGAVYVFVRNGSAWPLQAKLLAQDSQASDRFGSSVAIDADVALVGAPSEGFENGAVYVFVRNGASWSQEAKLAEVPDAGFVGDFGGSVALAGTEAVVADFGSGAAYVFNRNGTAWARQARLSPDDHPDFYGTAVSIDANSAVVGADKAAYVFVREGTSWRQQAKLLADDGAIGVSDNFGNAVSIDGDTVLVGSSNDSAAYVFVRTGSEWTQQAKLSPGDFAVDFGISVSLVGDTALVGAAATRGAYLFTRTGGTWIQQTKLTVGGAVDFGWSLVLDQEKAVVGDPQFGTGPGEAYLFSVSTGAPDDECISAIGHGEQVAGAWSSSCPSTQRPGSFARYFTFTLPDAREVEIELESDQADTFLFLLTGSGMGGEVVAMDDDGGTGTNSRIEAALGAGSYTIEATTYDTNVAASFVLTLEVAPPAGGGGGDSSCIEDATTACLLNDRFEVRLQWTNPENDSGFGLANELTSDTAYFYFFQPTNVEAFVKVLDACGDPFNAFWVFAGGLTDLRVEVIVRDSRSGQIRSYINPAKTPFRTVNDTAAFATCP